MIVWFNCKISDIRPNPQPRYHLKNNNRFDIARYSFASMAPLSPIVSKFVFNLEMADGHAGQEKEMESWLRSVLPEDKLIMNWYRCNSLDQWQQKQKEFEDIGDKFIFMGGNEDHVFVDNNIDIFAQFETALSKDPSIFATALTTHYPECIRASHVLGGQWSTPFVKYVTANNDSNRIIKKELFDWYLDRVSNPNKFMFRTEHWNDTVVPDNIAHTATKEQFRHFDGYAHVGIQADQAPPLEIPDGYFEGQMRIRYGFDDHLEGYVNINPASKTLYAQDGRGADYRFCLDDIPAFWAGRIKEITVNDAANLSDLVEARDKDLLKMSRIPFNWPHFGIDFARQPYPPTEWINPHTVALEFSDE